MHLFTQHPPNKGMEISSSGSLIMVFVWDKLPQATVSWRRCALALGPHPAPTGAWGGLCLPTASPSCQQGSQGPQKPMGTSGTLWCVASIHNSLCFWALRGSSPAPLSQGRLEVGRPGSRLGKYWWHRDGCPWLQVCCWPYKAGSMGGFGDFCDIATFPKCREKLINKQQ